jgi:hypothetical protein
MSNLSLGYSNYVQWYLKSELSSSLLIPEPVNWNEDSIKMKRHDDYHGMLYAYTGDLLFNSDAKDYIEAAYVVGGINAKCRLTKYVLTTKDGDVKWVERYSFLADWKTKVITNDQLSVKWNTFDLEELIRSHESDEFEAERLQSIDGEVLDPLILNKMTMQGRELNLGGQSKVYSLGDIFDAKSEVTLGQIDGWTPFTEIVSQGAERHSSVNDHLTEPGAVITSASMFYVDAVLASATPTQVDIRWDIWVSFNHRAISDLGGAYSCKIHRMETNLGIWTLVEAVELFSGTAPAGETTRVRLEGQLSFENVLENQALMIVYSAPLKIKVDIQNLYVNELSYAEPSVDLSCIFVHDLMERLMYILTGQKDMFASKYFARTEILDKDGLQKYIQDGDGALMAYITGYWLRGFDPSSDKYKSITTSIKNEINNLRAVYNIGITIETNLLEERLRFEDLKHFYRDTLIVKFPIQLNNVVRKVDSDLFFSAIEVGYEKADDYEDENGLDEPNQETSYVSPIRASEDKFKMFSKARTDDTAMELTRRKPAGDYPNEDTKRDDDIFLLDLKRLEGTPTYTQKIWSDRLKSLPLGIFSPSTWKGMFFTPMRMMLRHSWVFRAGMEPYLDRFVKHISSTGNKGVKTHANDDWRIGLDEPLAEDLISIDGTDGILVNNLERPVFLPELVTGEHVISEELWDWINGTTEVVVNGKAEQVPNYYFKMQWINENGEFERGYLMTLEPKGKGVVTFQKANENLI